MVRFSFQDLLQVATRTRSLALRFSESNPRIKTACSEVGSNPAIAFSNSASLLRLPATSRVRTQQSLFLTRWERNKINCSEVGSNPATAFSNSVRAHYDYLHRGGIEPSRRFYSLGGSEIKTTCTGGGGGTQPTSSLTR